MVIRLRPRIRSAIVVLGLAVLPGLASPTLPRVLAASEGRDGAHAPGESATPATAQGDAGVVSAVEVGPEPPGVAPAAASAELPAPEREPELLEFVEAVYPEGELRAGIEGTVLLELLVTETGTVDSVSVIAGLTPALDAAAREAAARFRFAPALADGAPVPVYVQFAYEFSLAEAGRTPRTNPEGVAPDRGPGGPTPPNDGAHGPGASLPAATSSTPDATPALGGEYEIVVYGEAEEIEVTRQSLAVSEVERLPGFGGDVVKSVQALPGVARPSLADPGAIVVRGSGNYDTRFFLDGVDIPLLFHFGGIESTYNSLALASVDLYPGGFGTRYGGAIGGVVELTGRAARNDRWKRIVDLSLLDGTLHVEGPLGRDWSLLLTARRSFVGEVASAVIGNSSDLDFAIAPYYWDGIVRLDRRLAHGGSVFLTAFAAGDRSEIVVRDEEAGSSEVNAATDAIESELRFGRAILGWDTASGGRLTNRLRLAVGRDLEDVHFFGEFDFHLESPYYQLRNESSFALADRFTTRLGLDAVYVPVEYSAIAAGWPASRQTEDFADLGAYLQGDWRPLEGLTLSPGLRYDHYTHLEEGEASVRLSSRYRWNAAHTFTGSIGTYNQPPQPIGQSTDPVFGNPDLPPTRATHLTLGDEWQIDARTSLRTEAYLNRQSRVPVVTDSAGLNFVADADARMYGLELMLRRNLGERFFGWLSYSIAKSERRYARRPQDDFAGFDEVGTDPDATWDPDAWVPHTFDQTHHFEAVGSYDWGNGISTGLRLQYVTGNPTTPYLSYLEDRYHYDVDAGGYLPVGGRYLADRMDPHVRVDFRIDRRFVRANAVYTVYADLQNVNYPLYESPEGYVYDYDYSDRKSYGWIPMPSLGFRAEF